MENTKRCPKCNKIKSIDAFYKNKSRKDGHSAWCKACDNTNNKKYVQNNREHMREYERYEYYKNHEDHKRRRKEYVDKNKEKVKQKQKEYYQKNREQILEYSRLYNQANKEKIRTRNKEYYESHKEDFVFKARERKKKIKETKDGTITKESLNIMYETQLHKCAYCNSNLDELGKHLDHILPLVKGGIHTLSNVHWVCPRCNLSKNDKTEEEWFDILEKQNKIINGKIVWSKEEYNESA